MPTLEALRDLIDRADEAMLRSISAHLQLALQVEREKRQTGGNIICPERVEAKRLALIAFGASLDPPLEANFITALWEFLHAYYAQNELQQRENAAKSGE